MLAPTDDWAPPDAPPDEDEYGDPVPTARPPASTQPAAAGRPAAERPAATAPNQRPATRPAAAPTPESAAPTAPATPAPAAAQTRPVAVPAAAAPTGASGGAKPLDVTDARRAWDEILRAVQRRKRVTQALLSSAVVTDLTDNVLHLTVTPPAMARRVMEAGNVSVLREAIQEVLSVEWAIRCDSPNDAPPHRRPALTVVPDPPPDNDDTPDDYDVRVVDDTPREKVVVGDPEVTAIELLTQQLGARRLDS